MEKVRESGRRAGGESAGECGDYWGISRSRKVLPNLNAICSSEIGDEAKRGSILPSAGCRIHKIEKLERESRDFLLTVSSLQKLTPSSLVSK